MSDLHPRVYWTADRSALVEEGDSRAAFLAYAPADPIAPEHLTLLSGKPAPGPEPVKAAEPNPKPVPVKPAPKPRATRKRA